jgi:dTDP-glucose 4,6-dehydratase
MNREQGLPPRDLDQVFDAVSPHWGALRAARIFITGGTGFVGKWLLETLLDADERLGLGCEVTVLTRDPDRFRMQSPGLAGDRRLQMVRGDVRDFAFPDGLFPVVIHAATDVADPGAPEDVFWTCIHGTRRVLDFAAAAQASRVLLVSSGAVYGRQPTGLVGIPEGHSGAPDSLDPGSAYGLGKRAAEWLAAARSREAGFALTIARCFAFVGPHLPLEKRFAIGNFIRDAAAGREITVQGDGSSARSYLYAADMAVWLWHILFRGRSGEAYNVGSGESLSIAELAERVRRVVGSPGAVRVLAQRPIGVPAERYVPDVSRALAELGLKPVVPLDEGIARTWRWAFPSRNPGELRCTSGERT